ncbi:hypothetical protein G9C98_007477, partial [Cotesia typhae]
LVMGGGKVLLCFAKQQSKCQHSSFFLGEKLVQALRSRVSTSKDIIKPRNVVAPFYVFAFIYTPRKLDCSVRCAVKRSKSYRLDVDLLSTDMIL